MGNDDLILQRLMDISASIGTLQGQQEEAREHRKEVLARIDGLSSKIDETKVGLDTKIDQMKTAIDARIDETDGRVDAIETDRKVGKVKLMAVLALFGFGGGTAGATVGESIWDKIANIFS